MGFLSDVFGGRGGTVETRPLTTPQQNQVLAELLKKLGTSPEAGRSATTRTSLAALEQAAVNTATAGTPQNPEAAAALSDLLAGGNPTDFEDYYESTIRDPLIKDFNEFLLPAVQKQFGGSNYFSTDRTKATNKTVQDVFDTLASSRAELSFKTQEAAKDRQSKAVDTSTGLQAQITSLIPALVSASGQIDKNAMDNLLRALNVRTTENIGLGAKQGGVDADTALAIAGAAMLAFSDIRLKRNIIRIGKTMMLPVYLFQYIWSPVWHVGVMAQEAFQVIPEAVYEVGGFLAVDYSKLR